VLAKKGVEMLTVSKSAIQKGLQKKKLQEIISRIT
jgi:carbamoylphosphate synthase large subunit